MASPGGAGAGGAGRRVLPVLLTALVLAVFARTFVLQGFRIPSSSMAPGLLAGDHVLVDKFIFDASASPLAARLLPLRPIRRGDVVVFKLPAEPRRAFVKRCVGLPGDTIEIRDRLLWLNGRPVDERGYLSPASGAPPGDRRRPHEGFGPLTVPLRQYFCLGDNRDDSEDSRFFGTVPASYVKGRVVLVYGSVAARESGRHGFFARLRWQRIGRLVR